MNTCRHCGVAIRWLRAMKVWATDDMRRNVKCVLSPDERHHP